MNSNSSTDFLDNKSENENNVNQNNDKNLQQAILSTAENALGKIHQIEKDFNQIKIGNQQEAFNQLCDQLQNNTANQLLKQANKWTQDKLGSHGRFERKSIEQYQDNVDFFMQNEEETHPYVENEIQRFKDTTIKHHNHLSALKLMLSDHMQMSPKSGDSIAVPSLQFNFTQKQKQATEAEIERKREKTKEWLRIEDELETKMRQYRSMSDQLRTAVSKIKTEYAAKSEKRFGLEEKLKELQKQRTQQIEHLKRLRQEEEQEFHETELKLRTEDENRIKEEARRKAEVKRIKEEAYKRKLARLKYFKGESVTVEPIPLDYEALKKKYDLLFNPANRKSVEVTYSLQNCVDENGIPKNDLIKALLSFAGKSFNDGNKVTTPQKQSRKSVRFSQNFDNSPLNPSSQRVMSPGVRQMRPLMDLPETTQRCSTPNMGGSDTTYVFTEKYKSADGKERDYGVMKPQSIKPCQGGYRVIFRDGNDGMVIDTRVKSQRENIIVLTAMSPPTRISNVFSS